MERAFGPEGGHGQFWNRPKIIERLKMTDEQRKSFDGIYLEHREKLIDLRGGVEKAELELEPLMGADQPNEARILSQIDKVAQARAELEKANARFLLAIRAKLTPEQWKQLQADRANHEQPRGSWAGRGQGANRPRAGEPGSGDMKPGGQFHRQAAPPPPPPPSTGGADAAPGAGAGDEQ
jgi:Spy/CpxP family protein refolding chaperone